MVSVWSLPVKIFSRLVFTKVVLSNASIFHYFVFKIQRCIFHNTALVNTRHVNTQAGSRALTIRRNINIIIMFDSFMTSSISTLSKQIFPHFPQALIQSFTELSKLTKCGVQDQISLFNLL